MIRLLLACVLLTISSLPAPAAPPHVVVSIAPLHALISSLMVGVGTPDLIVPNNASPHAYALRPSQARALENADVIFWVGPSLEQFLTGPIQVLGANATSVALEHAPDLVRLHVRIGDAFEPHAHHHDEPSEAEHNELEIAHDEDGDGEDGEVFDSHLWLDPHNAIAMLRDAERTLIEHDPTNEAAYRANAAQTVSRLEALMLAITIELEPVKDLPFVVFHDAYQHFENRFGLHAAGSITLGAEQSTGVRHIADIQERIRDLGVTCAFSEPQFSSTLIDTVARETNINLGILDPLGAALEPGPDLYFDMMRAMAHAMRACLQDG